MKAKKSGRERVFAHIERFGPVTVAQIVEATGRSRARVRADVLEGCRTGRLVRAEVASPRYDRETTNEHVYAKAGADLSAYAGA